MAAYILEGYRLNEAIRRSGSGQKNPWVPEPGTPQRAFKLKDGGSPVSRIVTVTPAGRRRYMEVLRQWLALFEKWLTSRNLVSGENITYQHQWWINTEDKDDIRWIKDRSTPLHEGRTWSHVDLNIEWNHNSSIYTFFRNCRQPTTIYIRLDDDIAYAPPSSIWALAMARARWREPFLILGNTVNNALCTHLHHRMGLLGNLPENKEIPKDGTTPYPEFYGQYFCTDANGWFSGRNAEAVHRNFLEFLKDYAPPCGNPWTPQMLWQLQYYERYSINTISWLGEDMQCAWESFNPDEEYFLTQQYPKEIKRPNAIYMPALFAHLAFHPQRPHVDQTDILAQYREIVDRETASWNGNKKHE